MDNDSRNLRPSIVRWHDGAYWCLLLAACTVFFVMNLWTSFKEDDMEFSLLRNAGLMDFLRSQYDHYMTSNGRCADFFATLFCAYLGKPAFNIVNTLVFALMAHLVVVLSTGRRSVTALMLFVVFVATCYPVPGQTMLFVAGSCNYMWAIVASLALVGLLQRYHGVKLGWGKTAVLMLLALLAGNLNEATSFGFFGGMVLYYALNRRQFDRNACLALSAYLVGVLLIVASPGAWARVAMGGIAVDMSLGELVMSRGYIFAKMMVMFVMPVAAVITGIVAPCRRGVRPVKRCLWTYVLLAMAGLMLVLGYLYERAYAPLATVSFIIVAMGLDAALMALRRQDMARLLLVFAGAALSVMAFGRALHVLHDLRTFEQDIERQIAAAPRHAVLHEFRFAGHSRFAVPLRYVSTDFFNREATYCAYYDKDNVQFVSDSVYDRYHSGRLLEGATLLPLVSDRPEIADTVLAVPGQDYMVVMLNVDTLRPTPQQATYYLSRPDSAMTAQERQFRTKHGLAADFEPRGFFPLYYQGRQMLVFPLIDDATSRIVFQLDYDNVLGNMTLSRKEDN